MDPSVENLPPEQRPGAAPTTPCSSCYCKRCAFHCMLCFQKKALGISYGRRFRKRPRSDQNVQNHPNPVPIKGSGRAILPFLHRSIPNLQRQQSRQKEQKEALAAAAGPDPCDI
ncbi:tat protein [Simian immunodeficiency virus]|uniref:Protein Tat n=1 Tax=Simian immunodeficiency virus TaxID=11723 RepID=A4UDG6_SIV|nr:tat protein [Simian immunodeficiency virus]